MTTTQAKGYKLSESPTWSLAEAPAAVPALPDKRRITESDPDFRRIHAAVERQLWSGIRAYVRALQSEPASQHAKAASVFIAHQLKALQAGYLAGHWEGERDYWHAFSAKHSVQAHSGLSQRHGVAPSVQRMRRALLFYGAGSITKMAREAQAAWAADQHAKIVTAKPTTPAPKLAESITLDDAANAAMNAWLGGLTARVALSADIAWTGMQDGYLAAGTIDPANPYGVVWWQLEPAAQHCEDCPSLASGSPYTAPGAGGNELPQTPGDGGTECGASCKCTLQYGSPLIAPMAWTGQAAPPVTPTPPSVAPSGSAGQPANQNGMPPEFNDYLARRDRAIAEALRNRPGLAYPIPPVDEWTRNYWKQITEATHGAEPWKSIADALTKSAEPLPTVNGSAPWQQIADALIERAPISEEEAKQQMASPPLDGQLTEGQKGALDLYRKAALAWDQVRGSLPPLDLFTTGQDWQDVSFDTLTPEQRDAYASYIEALREWADSTPIDQIDQMDE